MNWQLNLRISILLIIFSYVSYQSYYPTSSCRNIQCPEICFHSLVIFFFFFSFSTYVWLMYWLILLSLFIFFFWFKGIIHILSSRTYSPNIIYNLFILHMVPLICFSWIMWIKCNLSILLIMGIGLYLVTQCYCWQCWDEKF